MKPNIMKRMKRAVRRCAASLFAGEGKPFPPRINDKVECKVEVPTMHVMHDLGELPAGWYEEF